MQAVVCELHIYATGEEKQSRIRTTRVEGKGKSQ